MFLLVVVVHILAASIYTASSSLSSDPCLPLERFKDHNSGDLWALRTCSANVAAAANAQAKLRPLFGYFGGKRC